MGTWCGDVLARMNCVGARKIETFWEQTGRSTGVGEKSREGGKKSTDVILPKFSPVTSSLSPTVPELTTTSLLLKWWDLTRFKSKLYILILDPLECASKRTYPYPIEQGYFTWCRNFGRKLNIQSIPGIIFYILLFIIYFANW